MSQEDIDLQLRILAKDPGNLKALVRFVTYVRRINDSKPLDYNSYASKIRQTLNNYVQTLNPHGLSDKDWVELYHFVDNLTNKYFVLKLKFRAGLPFGEQYVNGSFALESEDDNDLPNPAYWFIQYSHSHDYREIFTLSLRSFKYQFRHWLGGFEVTETLPF